MHRWRDGTQLRIRRSMLGLLTLALVAGCAAPVAAPATAPGRAPGSGEAPAPAAPAAARESRTLVAAIRVEPQSIAGRLLQAAGVGLYLPRRMFNADIAYLDDRAVTRPYLVESIPEVGTESWRVLPDSKMETTYRLRPNIQWHDGTPLSAEDWVFSWRVYSTPVLGQTNLAPFRAIEDVEAPDARTLVIRWKQLYPDIAFVTGNSAEFPPLPRHILERTFQPDQVEPFVNQLYWTREYVGLGPYKLDRWEAGTFIEAVAFDAHIGGRPKIDRIKLVFMPDARTALAGILSGDIHMTDGTSVGLPEVAVLKRQWMNRGLGTALFHPNQWRAAFFQFRPEIVQPRALLNPVVRRALAHSVDRQPLNDALYDGDGVPSDSMFAPQSVWGPAAERGAVKYPYDPARSEQLMREAGFVKGPDGFYTSPAEGRLAFEVKTNQASDNESEVSILASTWRQNGFDAQEAVLPAAQAQNAQLRSTYTGLYTNSQNCCESAAVGLVSRAIPTADNRWSGGNRSGWSNPEYDRLADLFTRTLDRGEREQQLTQLVRTLTEDVQSITLFIRGHVWVHVTELKGMTVAPPEGNMSWSLPEWEFR